MKYLCWIKKVMVTTVPSVRCASLLLLHMELSRVVLEKNHGLIINSLKIIFRGNIARYYLRFCPLTLKYKMSVEAAWFCVYILH